MASKKYVILLSVLFTCICGLGIPYLLTRSGNQVYYDPDLKVFTKEPTATTTHSTASVLTREAFAAMFITAGITLTASPTDLPSATPVFTITVSITPTQTLTVSPTGTPIPPTLTNRPKGQNTAIPPTASTGTTPTVPVSTNISPTNPPPTVPPPTNPPATATTPPILPPIINTLIPIFP